MTNSEARFTINVREGVVELEGKESFVDKHLEKFEDIFKMAVKEAITHGLEQSLQLKEQSAQVALPAELVEQKGISSPLSNLFHKPASQTASAAAQSMLADQQ